MMRNADFARVSEGEIMQQANCGAPLGRFFLCLVVYSAVTVFILYSLHTQSLVLRTVVTSVLVAASGIFGLLWGLRQRT